MALTFGPVARRWTAHIGAVFGALLAVWLFVYLLRQQVFGPVALLSAGGVGAVLIAAATAIDPPPAGLAKKLTWLGFGAGILALLIGAAVMWKEVSGR